MTKSDPMGHGKEGLAAPASALPEDFQERVFKAIAVQRPAATAYIKELRRKNPAASPAQIMKTLESQYIATTTLASAAVGASATIPAVGIPVAIGLGVADLLFFYETTALFALCMAEVRGIPIDDPERAKAVVLGAMLGEKRKSKVTELVLAALPAGTTIAGARGVAGAAISSAAPQWGDLLAQQIPDSALVPVTMVLAKSAIAQGAVMGTVRVSSKAIPVIGAVAGGVTSYYFGSAVVKSCRAGFSPPATTWPVWLELTDADADVAPAPSRAVVAMRSASTSAITSAKGTATTIGGKATGVAKSMGSAASKATGSVVGMLKRNTRADDAAGDQADRPGHHHRA